MQSTSTSKPAMTLPTPRAVIFDWDNTLVNTWPIIHAALVATFEAMGLPAWSYEQTTLRVRKSMRDSFPEIFGKDWEKAGAIYQKHYRDHHLNKLEPLPGAKDMLQAVKDQGLYSVVVSNKRGNSLREEVAHLGWNEFFDKVVGSDDAARDKPHADPVHLALEGSRIDPAQDVWFIGDSDIDLECALNTGCTAILYGESARGHEGYSATHYRGFPYHAHVHQHSEIIQLLER